MQQAPPTAEEQVLAELGDGRDERAAAVRRSLAVGGYVRGSLSAVRAAQLVDSTPEDFAHEVALSFDRLPDRAYTSAPMLSVVMPVYNEEENIPTLLDELVPVLDGLGTFEVILVDDGSRDRSVELILERRRQDPRIKLLELSRNFGHQAALSAGLAHAEGRAVAFMDADMQDPPELLREFVRRWQGGEEVVYAIRTKRKESAFKRAGYWTFYRLLRRLADIEIPLDAGDFCLMDRKVVDALVGLPETSRFLRGLRTWVGFKQCGVLYERPARHAGEVKYTLRKLIRLAISGLLAFTSTPLRLASYLGFLTAAMGVVYLAVALVARIAAGSVPEGWTSLIAIVLILGGAQLLVMGVLGEYLAKVYEESKRRPAYVVGRRHGVLRSQNG
jgi:polyisoprenyl-phosphate glycosyltransferase